MKRFLAIVLVVITAFVSSLYLFGCDGDTETPEKEPPNSQTEYPNEDDGSGEGNSSGKPIITPDGEGIQFPCI